MAAPLSASSAAGGSWKAAASGASDPWSTVSSTLPFWRSMALRSSRCSGS